MDKLNDQITLNESNKSIEVLDLYPCQYMTHISKSIGKLSNLTNLYIDKSSIENIPEEIIKLSKL